MTEHQTRHVFQDERDDEGSHRYCAASLDQSGRLIVTIHDLGPVVQSAFGVGEYESVETYSPEQTQTLREHLGDDLIAAIAERFGDDPSGLSKVAEETGVGRGEVWSRIGD